MKNNDLMGVFLKKYPEFKQLTRIMRIFILCLLCSVQILFAADSFSQNARVTMNMKNVQLAKVLSEIESQTNYLFIYNNKVEVKQSTTVNVKDKPTSEVLDQVLKNTNISYSMEGSHIILSSGSNTSSVQSVAQQDRLVTGTIKDKSGEPLIGVSVAVKGTTIGTMTDIDGNFSIRVPEGKSLEVTYIGYVTQTLSGNQSSFNVVLQESDVNLDEVVVTALGIKRAQKALSYNVQEIKGEELTGVKDPNFMNSLSGKVAGVNINASSAGIGGATRVVMRGSKSITKDNNALYVIDGVPIFNANNGGLNQNNEYADQPRGEGIADLNPDDIESMSVLTGPAAAALYGSNAANGAIVITTKKGVAGKPKVTISNQTTFSRPFVSPDFQNKYGNRSGEYKSWGDIQNKYSYDPMDFFNTGATVQTSATLSVGTDKNQTFMSLGSTSSTGIIPENEYSKYNVTLRNTTKFLNDKMTLDFGLSYIKQKDQNMMAQGQYYNPLTAVYTYPRGEDFSYAKNYETYSDALGYNVQNWTWGDQGLSMQNPYWVINRNRMVNKRDRYMMNVNLQYDILDWMNVMGRARLDNSYNNFTHKNYASTYKVLSAASEGRFKSTKEDYKQAYADFLLNINKYFGNYSLTANVGTSISDMRSDESGIDGALMIPNFFANTNVNKNAASTKLIQNGWHEQTQSVFANVELGWKSMLYLTLTGRNDWASALANTSNSSFFYPSVGLSGVISEMVTMPSFISYMKVRGSYSSVGSAIPRNLSIPTYKYDEQSGTWETNTYMPITDLKPERTGSWEAGLSSKFWNNRLSLDVTWYKSNTKNQTLNVPVSASTGYSSMYIQTGDVENQGVEITLGADNKWGDFSWNSTFTASYNKNEIKQLGKYADPITGEMITLEYITQGGIGSSEFRLMSGGTMGDLWMKRKLKYDDNGDVVLNGEGQPVLEDTMEKAGSVLPKWNLGFRNDFRWKDFNFGFLVSARLGGIVMSPTQAILDGFGVTKATADARDNGGVMIGNTKIGAEQYYTAVGQTEGLLSDYIYKATNVRLQEVTIGYNLPSKWFSDVMRVNVSFVGRNLWMIYNKAPFDPEATASTGTYFQGIDYFMQPSLRNLGFSVKVEF